MPALNKEADLVCAVLLYVARCRQEGDARALRAMNIGAKELDAIAGLDLSDLSHAQQLYAHGLNIRLDQDAFWPMVELLKQRRASEAAEDALMQADAPAQMMRALFGMDAKEYTRRCRQLGVRPTLGRPQVLDEVSEHALWKHWEALCNPKSPTPDDYLLLAQESGLQLRVIWRLVTIWIASMGST